MLEKVVSGGQTGVDRAALDAAMAAAINVGGWCPKGRRAMDGMIPDRYPLTETPARSYKTRTRWNVRDSDATLIVCRDEPSGGTALTIEYCQQLGRPYEITRLFGGKPGSPNVYGRQLTDVVDWLRCQPVNVLNVAGPREGKLYPIYDRAYAFLHDVFLCLQKT